MKLLRNNDLKTFEQLCGLSQNALHKTLNTYLKSKYKQVVCTKDYTYAIGDIPIALVAHMDTVFKTPAKDIFYDRVKNVMWSPQGLGADDRASVFAIIQIIRKGFRPHIIFTTDEEKGCLGADKLARIPCPFEDLRYIIQLDRRGANDCVFYECDNAAFVEYVESFGFVEAIGSFSDISSICPAWKIAGVNLSVGYRDEHSVSEVLFVGHLLNTIEKVARMLQDKEIPVFEYIPLVYDATCKNYWYRWLGRQYTDPADDKHCHICGKEYLPEELIPVSMLDYSRKYFCIDCISGRVDWCNSCGEAYEIPPAGVRQNGLCEDCTYDAYYNY
jgi:hypothetical protein